MSAIDRQLQTTQKHYRNELKDHWYIVGGRDSTSFQRAQASPSPTCRSVADWLAMYDYWESDAAQVNI